jgi:hypothetical protein
VNVASLIALAETLRAELARIQPTLPAKFPALIWAAIANGLGEQARLFTEFA